MLARTVLTESLENEVGDGLPLQAKVRSIINGIEGLIEKNTEFINPQPFRLLISQLRNQVSDVASLERGMDSIRREIITPVRHELEHSAKLGRFSVWGFWVGLVGGVLAIFSLSLSLWQGFRYNKPAVQSDKSIVAASPAPSISPANASVLENFSNVPSAFYFYGKKPPIQRSHFTREHDTWFQEYPDGRKVKFALHGRIVVQRCVGSLLSATSYVDREIFVPDKGCGTMEISMRNNGGPWDVSGRMEDIR